MYNNILVPISFDEDRDSNKAIKVAQTLAGDGGTVTLFHVMEQIPSYAISYMPTDYITELETLAGNVKGGKAVLVEGHSARTILEWADKHAVDCIIIASHRPGMQDLLLGSTATTVVRHARCAVHVLR